MVDIVNLSSGNPCETCRDIVALAYVLWLQFDVRTDDITVIVAYIDDEELGAAPRKPNGSMVCGERIESG